MLVNNDNTNRSTIYSNLRYSLSSKMMNDYFLQWLSQQQNQSLIDNMISEIINNPNVFNHPNPLFISSKQNLTTSLIPPASPKKPRYYTAQNNKNNYLTKSLEVEGNKAIISQSELGNNKVLSSSVDDFIIKQAIPDQKQSNSSIISKKPNAVEASLKQIKEIPQFLSNFTSISESDLTTYSAIFDKLPDEITSNVLKKDCSFLFGLDEMYSNAILNKFFCYVNNINIDSFNPLIESTATSVVIEGTQQDKSISKIDFIQ